MTNIESAYQRFSTERFPLRAKRRSRSLSNDWIVFPAEFRQFLLEYNGGYFKNPEIGPVNQECPRQHWQFSSVSGRHIGKLSSVNLHGVI